MHGDAEQQLRQDRLLLEKACAVLGLFLAAVWSGWFFFYKVGRYEVAASARVLNAGVIEARFSKQAIAQLRSGLPAKVSLIGYDWPEFPYLNGRVGVVLGAGADQAIARVGIPAGQGHPIPLRQGMEASVKIKVSDATPYQAFMGILGRNAR